MKNLFEIMAFAGGGLLVAGAYLAHPGVALVVAGAMCLYIGIRGLKL